MPTLPVGQRRGSGGDHGFALIIVIWALGIVALLAAGFAKRLHTETLVSRNQLALAEAESIANGGVFLIARQLMRVRQAAAPSVDANGAVAVARLRCRLGDSALDVRVEDEAGRIDLNTASDRLLSLLFTGAGADPVLAGRFVDRLVDFRDQDDLVRLNGAENRAYQTANAAAPPKNASFESVEELEQVLGMPPELYRSVRPFLSAFHGGGGVDQRFADRRLLAILDHAVAGSSEASTPATGAPTGQTIPQDVLVASPKRVYRILSRAQHKGGAIYAREAVVELVDRPSRPFVLKMWSKASLGDNAQPISSGTPGESRSDLDDCRTAVIE